MGIDIWFWGTTINIFLTLLSNPFWPLVNTSRLSMDGEKMTKEQSREIWEIIDADTAQHSDYAVFFFSGKRLVQRMAFGLLPSFVQRRIRPGLTKPQRLLPTSYLDGLRGVSSFIVFLGHYTEENLGWYTEPYGAYEDGAASSPLQFPFVRVIYSARPMVHIFLIISGYVLSYKPLKQIHSQQYSALAITLSSSVFRRALRLFLPSFVTLFIMALALFLGFSTDRYAERQINLPSQLHHVWDTCIRLLGASWALDDTGRVLPIFNFVRRPSWTFKVSSECTIVSTSWHHHILLLWWAALYCRVSRWDVHCRSN